MGTRMAAGLLAMAIGGAGEAGQVGGQGQGPLITHVAQVTIVVKDQDEALRFYTEKLGMEKRQDATWGKERWLTVAPSGQKELEIVLQDPKTAMDPARGQALAAQIGRGPTWVLHTDDCQAAYDVLKARGVKFTRPPEKLPYGVQALMEDLYGNPFALVGPAK